MTRDRSKREAFKVRRGDRVTGRGKDREVKAVRNRQTSGGQDVLLVFKEGRSLRVAADKLVSFIRRGRGRR